MIFLWSDICCNVFLPICTLTLLVGHQEEHPARKKIEWRVTGMVVCLEYGANDLHMVQLMLLPSHHLLLQ